jgi:hypothetical protein
VIVDGGSFLGSSLVAEAKGMEANPALAALTLARFPSSKPIHGYELGYHPAPANPAAERRRTYGGAEYVLGESFVPMLEQNIAPHRDLIDLHIGDLTEMSWDGSPVELAFIDVCKTPELNSHVSRQLYPALIGGASTHPSRLLLRPTAVDQGHAGLSRGLLPLGGSGREQLGIHHRQRRP